MTRLLAFNGSALELAFEQAVAAPALPVPLRDLVSPDNIAAKWLPWLAFALSVDDWDPTWPESVRRRVVAQSIDVHRRKGTLAAVKQAVAAFGGSISIREWWETEPPGEPGTFSLVLAVAEIAGAAPGAAYVEATLRQVTQAKPLSRPFDFTLALSAAGAIGAVAGARPTVSTRLDMAA